MILAVGSRAPESTSPFHALAPLRFPADLRLTPEPFALVCAETREAVLELAADGRLIAMTPTGGETGGDVQRLAAGPTRETTEAP